MTPILSACVQRKTAAGEMALVASQAVAAGQTVLLEAPLVSLDIGAYEFGSYCWDLVDRILSDASLLSRVRKLHLAVTPFLRDPLDEMVESALVARHHKSRQLVRELFFCVGTNNVGVLNDSALVVGYGLYPMLSRADHSCEPSARLTPGPEPKTLALVATRDLCAGEAVTWSYFREAEFLSADFETRNLALVNVFRFACRCARCKRECPPHLQGRASLVPYFDELIRAQARELAQQPGGIEQALAEAPMAVHHAAFFNASRSG